MPNGFRMLSPVSIKNFKSLRSLQFEARRVNIFIGEPNTGKSNILEALAFFSPGIFNSFQEILRYKSVADLFFDQKLADALEVEIGEWKMTLRYGRGDYEGFFFAGGVQKAKFELTHQGLRNWGQQPTPIRYFCFKPAPSFPNDQPSPLNPPFGDNLVAVLYTNEPLRKRIGEMIRAKGFRLQLKPTEHELLIAKDVDDELYSYPWTSVSETVRRVAFLMAALETNQGNTLLLDEPEANTFPFYTKYVAERIVLDESNQFFITTHNPYLLSSVVEKTPAKDLAVFVTRMEKFETKLKQIPQKNIPELLELDADAFFNLDRLVDE